MLKESKNNKVGRPRKQDSEKVIYQKIPLRYDTYKKLKEITTKENTTFSDKIEEWIEKDK